ncbi:hypothetical protein A7U43_12250 [Mycobacterium adipatum]|jgi:hypothetical protein|uniref:Uncharacterized protein n=1 Tax=Mycobacterium adipatum TaxID=1682113 RepID=A0A172UL98_9MYCO|nr:hypothetical protein [Mycobacterium adipatum]ANE79982.1 hypothetical protein A7U43_12250 [Mycobacterium adipatum]MBI5736067.1 hypothetical protein [Mycolicibacterium neoaurum]
MTTFTRLGFGLAATAVSISMLSGCSKIDDIKAITDAATTAVEQLSDTAGGLTEIAAGDLVTVEGIDRALGAISQRVGANPMQVVELVITEQVVTVQAVNPAAPTELNQWTYTAGQVGDLRPVDYDDDTEALQQNLFPVTEVPATAIMTAVDNAIGASGIADGEVQTVIVKRNLPFSDDLQILINVQGERSNKQVRADATGQVTGVV